MAKYPLFIVFIVGCIAVLVSSFLYKKSYKEEVNIASLVVHGGAGTTLPENIKPELKAAYNDSIKRVLMAGYALLEKGVPALDVVERVVALLEDDPLFNAGKGSVFAHSGEHELDASIMDGKTLQAGAVAVVKHIKNPIHLARLILDKSEYLFLSGLQAEEFARLHALEIVSPDYFFTQKRYNQLKKALVEEDARVNHYGTVGAVACDTQGNCAAATSTGGLTNKKYGRIGDSPVIGAGSYANNNSCAVSCTGQGEYFIRTVAAHTVSMLMQYGGYSINDACKRVIKEIGALGGHGGIIAVDRYGKIGIAFNTPNMHLGYIQTNLNASVASRFTYKIQ